MIPFVQELVPVPDPVRCCERLEGLPLRLFLDSAARSQRLGRHSFLMADPVLVVRARGSQMAWRDSPEGPWHAGDGDVFAFIRAKLAPHVGAPLRGLPPFQGGAAGYIGYDWGLTLERLPSPRYDDHRLDDIVLGLYDWVLAWDHESSRAWLISTGMPDAAAGGGVNRADARAAVVLARLAGDGPRGGGPSPRAELPPWHAGLASNPTAPAHAMPRGWWSPRLALHSSFTREGYIDAVARVRDYIRAGDIFQANMSQRFEAPLTERPWLLYERLRARNAAPFAGFFELPEASILSASPERFLRMDAAGHVETRPIKGTRPRGLGPEHDAALGQALADSVKDRAENLMIVDLMRNDLSRVCMPGTVRVPELFTLERYATVHHLVSTVIGQLAPGYDAFDLLRAAFPGGSITGAPKLRAMEIIAELEPSRRGVYCGSLGYWSITGDMDTSIAIRTAVARGGRVYFSAGGGIVADSDPRLEYAETLDKARGIIDVLAEP